MNWSDWVGVIVVFLTGAGIILGGLYWLIRAMVRAELEKYTLPIQPGYRNGGASLADIAAKLDKILEGGSHG